jgi:hypothetical protein
LHRGRLCRRRDPKGRERIREREREGGQGMRGTRFLGPFCEKDAAQCGRSRALKATSATTVAYLH